MLSVPNMNPKAVPAMPAVPAVPADVKELTPEFYSQPEFLRNSNEFNLGVRQVSCWPLVPGRRDVLLWGSRRQGVQYQRCMRQLSDSHSTALRSVNKCCLCPCCPLLSPAGRHRAGGRGAASLVQWLP